MDKKYLHRIVSLLAATCCFLTVRLNTASGAGNDQRVPLGPLQTTWKQVLAGSLDQTELDIIAAIIDDIQWYVAENAHPETTVRRPRGKKIGAEHGLALLARIVISASQGETKAQSVLIGLFRISGRQGALENFPALPFSKVRISLMPLRMG